jgi:hypothetical protein
MAQGVVDELRAQHLVEHLLFSTIVVESRREHVTASTYNERKILLIPGQAGEAGD